VTFRARVKGRAYRAQRLRDYREEEVTFTSADGTRLAGSLFMPAGETTRPAVVFAHGSNAQTRNGFYGQIRFLAEAYARKGIAALAFDKRGTGDSAGDWEKASLATLGEDVAAGVRYLRSRRDVQANAIGLTGSSQAGWVMPLATRSVPDVRFIQHRSAASPLGVRAQERMRLKLQMEYDKYPPAEIARALRIRDMMDDYAVAGKGWDELRAAASLVEKEYWMTQFIGGLPARDASDWAWLRENFAIDTTADFVNFRGSWDVMYGAKDPIAPLEEGKAALEAALARGRAREATIEIVPDATHDYLQAKTGTDREFPGLQRFVPGIHARIVGWAAERVGPIKR
jgi:pimeloyl-ACP methyl ester carboxylesterase